MAYADLREFVAALERAGELRRVTSEVDPILEITEITDRVSKQGGPALLFERVKGASMPLLINAFGSPTRMNLALQVASPGDLAAELQDVLGPVETLDHASRLPKYGSKMGVDATRKWPEEGFTRPWPDEIVMDSRIKDLVDHRWSEYGLD
jgi:3-polyprenyl-4-hydroxybenzoate decarboxylase